MTVSLLRGNALALPLADATVDLVCTSPPYFGLRSYQDGGAHYPGQIGSEATPAEWLAAMLAATAEMVRVLKPSGSIWVNLGDRYTGGGSSDRSNYGASYPQFGGKWSVATGIKNTPVVGTRPKSLIGLPWRYAINCIDQLGLILRAEVIWSKPNGLPESVTDRVRRSHETWFHLVRQPRYFAAVDEIREAHGPQPPFTRPTPNRGNVRPDGDANRAAHLTHDGWVARLYNPLGKLPGSVWSIPSQPLTVPTELGVDHFAAFPMEWPRRLIAGWSPAGVCVVCGEGRRPVTRLEKSHAPRPGLVTALTNAHGSDGREGERPTSVATITGYVCGCPTPDAPTTPARILDPFGGTGTTALVAHVMGRHGIHLDMSADYNRLAAWRTTDPDQIAAAAQVEKPAKQTVGQANLLDLIDGGAA